MTNITTLTSFFEQLKYWLPFFFITLIVLETAYLLLRFGTFHFRETKVNLLTGLSAILAQSVVKLFFLTNLYPAVYAHRLWDIGLTVPGWILGFLLYTFIQFATHYGYHKIRLFWCLHEVHHSAIHMNTTTGLRSSVFDIVSLDILFLLIPWAGIDPMIYFVLYTLNKWWGSLIHLNEQVVGRIPWLEWILVTPSIHHIHHARNTRYLDKNYGEIIPWYDKLFGTYAPATEPPVYGTLQVQHELGFWDTQLHEFRKLVKDIRSAKPMKHKLLYLVMPPGWHPGDSSGTAYALQQQFKKEQEKTLQDDPAGRVMLSMIRE